MIRLNSRRPLLACCLLAAATLPARAQEAEDPPPVALHGQATWIRQAKPGFDAPYTGPNSLRPRRERSYSFTATADLGLRLWPGAQLHLNPEMAQGVPLSALTGAGSISNGELQRGSSSRPHGYLARAYLQQRVDLDGGAERIEPDFNELGGSAQRRRWTLTGGLVSLLDFFDPNPYAKDPREQFTNWAFLTHGAWDYAADARGYTYALIADYKAPGWGLRFGRAAQPRESNGPNLDRNLRRQFGDMLEVESDLPVQLPAGPLKARVLLFRNRIDGGSFSDAIAAAPPGGPPDVAPVRRLQDKTGWGLTLEAPLGEDQGLFLRASRSDGRVETYAFTEIDRQLAVGGQFSGAPWGRGRDRWGLAWAVNGLSPSHRSYLALGGLGFFLGDGRLNYAPEHIVETYYRWVLPDVAAGTQKLQSAVSAGFQWLRNPGYNRDRGPVQTWTLRWHAEF